MKKILTLAVCLLLSVLVSCSTGGVYPSNPTEGGGISEGATGIDPSKSITTTFAAPIDTSTVTTSTYYLSGPASTSGTVSLTCANPENGTTSTTLTTATFKPVYSQPEEASCCLNVTNGIHYATGIYINPSTICFTTGQAFTWAASGQANVNVLDSAVLSLTKATDDVSVSSPITLTFTEPLTVSTVTTDTLYLTLPDQSSTAPTTEFNATICDTANKVTATVACSSTTACTITPAANLYFGTKYGLCVTNGITYASGIIYRGSTRLFTTISSGTNFTVSGAVSGLSGTLVLQNNAVDDLTISENGSFTFATALASGSTYAVTVKTQPSGQTCTIANPSGTISGANIENVAVTCATDTYTVGGSVTGLSGTVVLQNNATDDKTITTNDTYTFATAIASGAAYAVTVKTQPAGQTCTIANPSGTISGNVTNVNVTCTTNSYSLGGAVSGLTGTVVIQNNGGDDETITENTPYTFATELLYNTAYAITVLTQPDGEQPCTVSNSSGTILADVTNANVLCARAQWAETATGGTQDAEFNAIAHDSAGNVYAAGRIYGAGTFNFGNGQSATGSDASYYTAVLVKYNSSLEAQWAAVSTGGSNDSQFDSVASDADGNAYVVGRILGTTEFDFGNGKTATGVNAGDNIIIVKYNSSGTAQWARTVVSASGQSNFNGVAIDPSGNAYAVGVIDAEAEYTFEEGLAVVTNPASSDSALIVRYNPSGVAQYAKTVSAGSDESEFDAIAVDSSGNYIYATGKIDGTGNFNFGNGIISAAYAGGNNAVIVKYSSSLVAQWAGTTTVAADASRYEGGVDVDSDGNIYAVGYIYGTGNYNFGSGVIHGTNAVDNAVIVKYASSSTGAAQTANTVLSGNTWSDFNAINIDASDNIYVVGNIGSNVAMNFGNGIIATGENNGSDDTALLVKYNSSLVAQWAGSSATASSGEISFGGVTVDDAGNVYAVGSLYENNTYDFGNSATVTGNAGADAKYSVVIVKYAGE